MVCATSASVRQLQCFMLQVLLRLWPCRVSALKCKTEVHHALELTCVWLFLSLPLRVSLVVAAAGTAWALDWLCLR